MEKVIQHNGTACLEWPTPCLVGAIPTRANTCLRKGIRRVKLHGCVLSLCTCKGARYEKSSGAYMQLLLLLPTGLPGFVMEHIGALKRAVGFAKLLGVMRTSLLDVYMS
eukprot:6058788-Pyramimonas_sp.AAC.1